VKAVAAGVWHSLALLANGTVAAWGLNDYGQCTIPAALQVPGAAVAIAAGGWHSLALKADGTSVAWGRNDFGQCNVPNRNIVPLLYLLLGN
jgi:alpha-tubulin suppressor-like RCC1 family protein